MTSSFTIQPIILSAIAVTMFQTAILFISGDLARTSLDSLYKVFPTEFHRTAFALLVLLAPGNLIVAQAFQNIAVAAPSVMLFQIWAAALAYCYINKTWLNPVELAVVVTISSLVLWLAIMLQAK